MRLADNARGVTLVAATPMHLDAEDRGVDALCALLGLAAPSEWPPEHGGPQMRQWLRDAIAAAPGTQGWWSWYVVARVAGDDTLVGIAGFKGPPDGSGTVEIGYSVIPAFRRRGYATAAVGLLVAHAFADGRVHEVAAETLPVLAPSQGVLRKCGFALVRCRHDPEAGEILRFSRDRAAGSRTAGSAGR
jgi:ribosomal-protein-alanine N-acetyltransferase